MDLRRNGPLFSRSPQPQLQGSRPVELLLGRYRREYPVLERPRQQIRLLHLLPPEENKPLHCHFSVHLLEDQPKYTALSYAWGEEQPEDDYHISCGNRNIPITSDLRDFLLQYQDALPPFPLWIDALCIDQGNIEEKSDQILIMSELYSQAHIVMIWLGKEDNDTVRVLELAATLLRVNQLLATENIPLDRQACLSFMSKSDFPGYNQPVWNAMDNFCRRPWFNRVWVIQEEALAQRKQYICGPYIVPDGLIAAVYPWLQAYSAESHESVESKVESVAHLEIYGRINSDDRSSDISKHIVLTEPYMQAMPRLTVTQSVAFGDSLLSLLRVSRSKHTSVAKDHIFGLLGIADEADTVRYGDHALRLPYSLSMTETFWKTTLHLIRHHESLEVLKMVEHVPRHVSYDLSWVPRWDKKLPVRATILSEVKDETGFSADGGIALELEEPSDNRFLAVRGRRLDRVIATSKIFSRYKTQHDDETQSMEILNVWAEFQKQMLTMYGMASYPTGEDIRKVFAMTITGGLDEHGRRADEEFWKHFLYQFAVETEVASVPKNSLERHWRWQAGFRDLQLHLLQEELKGGNRAHFLGAFYRSAEHRRLFLTANGHLGLGPAAVEVEDQVCVLFGSNVPYVYRSPCNAEMLAKGYLGPFTARVALEMLGQNGNEDQHINVNDDFYLPPYDATEPWDKTFLRCRVPKALVGHCYVHGMMHGEAVRNTGVNNTDTVVFEFG